MQLLRYKAPVRAGILPGKARTARHDRPLPATVRGIGRFLFEHAAQVVGPGKAAQAGDHVQRVFPVEQQPLGGLDAHGGQIPARRHPDGSGKGAHQMALGHAQPLAQLFHTVEPGVVPADVLDGGGHQRGQGRGGAVGV